MTERPATTLAVYLVLRRDDELLFLRRAGSGWQDGKLTLVAGHVDDGEPAAVAMAREAAEEVGVRVDPADLRLVHTMHRGGPTPYVDLYFSCARWAGEPAILEPTKASELAWHRLDVLPDDVIGTVAEALRAIEAGVAYSAVGWDAAP